MGAHRFESSVIAHYPSKAAWDAVAADTVATMLDRWQLTAGDAFTGGEAAAALAVTRADGTDAVLKVGFPHDEAVAEAIALDAWSPRFAPRVLQQDPWTWSLLLERVEPGIPLSRSAVAADEALAVTGGLLRRLHSHAVPHGVPGIREVVGPWVEHARETLSGPDADPHLKAAVRAQLDDAERLLAADDGDALLHGDANPGNILLGSNGDWLAIDPKPMRGRPEFDLQPAVEQLGTPRDQRESSSVLETQLRILVNAINGEMEIALRWARVRAGLNLAWAWADRDGRAASRAARALEAWSRVTES